MVCWRNFVSMRCLYLRRIRFCFTQSGGEYRLLSIILHPSIGFSAGIVSATVGFTAPAVLAALALGNYLKAIFSDINASYVAITVIVFIHLIHMSSLNAGKKFQDISTLLKIILITAFIFLVSFK